jgi:hypothetical protein
MPNGHTQKRIENYAVARLRSMPARNVRSCLNNYFELFVKIDSRILNAGKA